MKKLEALAPAEQKEAAESVVCREIVREIRRYGVNQKQLTKIIKLLALELEDRAMMERVIRCIEPGGITGAVPNNLPKIIS